jgi:holo-[acyl-carrier protein] synthase
MIVGLGVDVISVERIRAVHQRQGRRFLDRVYTPAEQAYCLGFRDPGERLAARWAAKEACMKALGTGWAAGVRFTDIAIGSDPAGAPMLQLSGTAHARALALRSITQHVSLSHADGMAVAVVVLESA